MFHREKRVPIVAGEPRYGRDTAVLASALGLKPVIIANRVANGLSDGMDSELAAVIREIEESTLERQIDHIRALVEAPASRDLEGNFDALAQDQATLFDAKSDVLAALEAVAFYKGENVFIARDNGRMLIDYLMLLPDDQFATVQPRVESLYHEAPSGSWMWEMSEIRERIETTGVVLAR